MKLTLSRTVENGTNHTVRDEIYFEDETPILAQYSPLNNEVLDYAIPIEKEFVPIISSDVVVIFPLIEFLCSKIFASNKPDS